MARMKAAVFVEPGRIVLEDKPVPEVGPQDALLRITTTTLCGTDVHILKGEYPVARGLTIGHEPVGDDREGSAPSVQGLHAKDNASSPAPSRPADGATPACAACGSQDGAGTAARLEGDGRLALRQHHRRLHRPSSCWYPMR